LKGDVGCTEEKKKGTRQRDKLGPAMYQQTAQKKGKEAGRQSSRVEDARTFGGGKEKREAGWKTPERTKKRSGGGGGK